MRLMTLRIVGLLATAYLGATALLYVGQHSLLYHPRPALATDDLRRFETGPGGPTVWEIAGGQAGALIYFGGNGEDITRNAAAFRRELPDWTVYLACYRGYCGSDGTPSESSLFADALTVHDALRSRHARLAALGRSLGSGVAVHLAAERPLDRLVLVTPYDSIEQVAASRYPAFPVRWLIRDRFDSLGRAPGLKLPVLALLAQHDHVIPLVHSERLIGALPAERTLVRVIAGTDHNSIGAASAYWAVLRQFLNPHPSAHPAPS
jgi:uncharacterized protein